MPGPTQLTRTPNRPSSAASPRATASTAPFVPADSPSRTGNRLVAAVVTATMFPPSARRNGNAGCTRLKNATASDSSCDRYCAGVTLLRCVIGTCGPAA
jgi:hypothetical protein